MRYLSVCSGIEAASVAWRGFGWEPVGFSEIDKGPSRVLAHHYGSNMPDEAPTHNGIPNFGDFTKIPLDTLGPVDLLVGGTPCQAFSVAGKRLSLADARGNLSLAYTVLAHELAGSHGLKLAVWENVPGVLSTKDNAFGCFLSGLVGSDAPLDLPKGVERWPDAGMASGPRARLAWRVLDAQYFGLAQRRRRVFVVASFGDGPDPAAILFERQGVRRNPPSRGKAGKDLAPTISARTKGGGGLGTDAECDGALVAADAPAPMAFGGGNCSGPIDKAACLVAKGQKCDFEVETFVAQCATGDVTHTLRAEGFDASDDGTGRGNPIVAHAFDARQSDVIQYGDMTGPLDTDGHSMAVAFSCKDYGADAANEVAPTMRAMGHAASHANAGGQLAVAFDLRAHRFTCRNCGRRYGIDDYPRNPTCPACGSMDCDDALDAQAYDLRGREGGAQFEGPHETANIRAASGGSSRSYVAGMAVRRLTPRECERLQGFPDDHTACLKSDGPRYKALGNSFATNVVRWIGERIKQEAA